MIDAIMAELRRGLMKNPNAIDITISRETLEFLLGRLSIYRQIEKEMMDRYK